MAATRPSINADELRTRLRTACRVPQLLELRDQVAAAMRQTSDAMDEDGAGGDAELKTGWSRLTGLFAEIRDRLTRQPTIVLGQWSGPARW
jgi:hypothetical protein